MVTLCPMSIGAAEIVAEHHGAANPTTEGWNIGGSGGIGVVVGPLVNDAGSGLDAWFVNDTSSVGGSNLSYFQLLTGDQVNQATTQGWSLTTTIRIPDPSDAAELSPFLAYVDGNIAWQVAFGSDADGDPIVLLRDTLGLFTGPRFTLQGAGSTYHTYAMVYDPDSGTVDLFVDGIERLSDHIGFGFQGLPTAGWGAGSSADQGQGNFNHVRFEINAIPEPASWTLLGVGMLVIGARRRRLRREVDSN